MLRLRVKAPFAAFRTFTAGSYRPTAPFLPPSTAYGLALNIAGIESRFDDGESLTTLTNVGLPKVEIALGAVRDFPLIQSVYQQLHNYPVGATGKERGPETKGTKYNIQPIRREFLSNLDAYVCLRDNEKLEEQVREGLRKGADFNSGRRSRYGVPFLGDNNFMIDLLREEAEPEPAYWYTKLTGNEKRDRVCRLTVWIDRANMARTQAILYAPTESRANEIPPSAWTPILPP